LLYFLGVEESFEKVTFVFLVCSFETFRTNLLSKILEPINNLLKLRIEPFYIVFFGVIDLEAQDIRFFPENLNRFEQLYKKRDVITTDVASELLHLLSDEVQILKLKVLFVFVIFLKKRPVVSDFRHFLL